MTVNIGVPNKKQREFFLANTRYVAYGGARGGGKSWAVRVKAMLLALNYGGIRILILRRSYPELRENHVLPLCAMTAGVAKYKDSSKSLEFPNGSRIRFGYCAAERDVLQYQGQEYDAVFLDEATQFTEFQFAALSAIVRGANDFPKRFYLTCNPGGVGHGWVKRLFIDRAYTERENAADYTFISAGVYDNAVLMEKDPQYVKTLEALPEDLRRAWLYGDWCAFAGQYFSEWEYDTHTVAPFALPDTWRRYAALDYGLDMFACYFFAVDESGAAYCYHEIYESGLIVSEAARRMKESMGAVPFAAVYAPPDLWNRHSDTGKSTAEIFAESGIYLTRAANDRVQGWYALKEWLCPVPDEFGGRTPSLRVFRTCKNLIRTLPQLQFDETHPNDVATEPHELTHAPDAVRYFVAGRPSRPRFNGAKNEKLITKLKRNGAKPL